MEARVDLLQTVQHAGMFASNVPVHDIAVALQSVTYRCNWPDYSGSQLCSAKLPLFPLTLQAINGAPYLLVRNKLDSISHDVLMAQRNRTVTGLPALEETIQIKIKFLKKNHPSAKICQRISTEQLNEEEYMRKIRQNCLT